MIKLDPDLDRIPTSTVAPSQETSSLFPCERSPPPKNLPLISIHNINTSLPKKAYIPLPHSNTLAHTIHRTTHGTPDTETPNNLIPPTLQEKETLYKTYLHYGNSPQNSKAMLVGLATTLSYDEIKDTRYAETLRGLLPALKLIAAALLSQTRREALTAPQLVEVNRREDVIRELIIIAATLPDMLLRTDSITRRADAKSIRRFLINELIQGALRRLVREKTDHQHTEMHTLLRSPPPSLRKKLDSFFITSQATLLKSVRKELRESIKRGTRAVISARNFIRRSPTQACLASPTGTDTIYTIHQISSALTHWIEILKKRTQHRVETKKIDEKQDDELSSDRMTPKVTMTKVAKLFREKVSKTKKSLGQFHRQMNREQLSPFSAQKQKSFLSLPEHGRTQCLRMKKIAAPVQENANTLQQTAMQLRDAIQHAVRENIWPLPLPQTAEEALFTELTLLTEKNPQIELMHAIWTAQTTAQQILNTLWSLPTTPPPEKPIDTSFCAIVQEYLNELVRGATVLKDVARQAETNVRQQSVLSALHQVEKIGLDVNSVLNNALESVSGVSLRGNGVWIRKLDIELHTHWQGITYLINKGHKHHPLHLHHTRETIQHTQILCVTLPLLNEVEKLRGACQKLEMTLGSPAKKTAQMRETDEAINHKIRHLDLTGITLVAHSIQEVFSGKNILIYSYYGPRDIPIQLHNVLQEHAQALMQVGQALQEAAWLISWSPEETEARQRLVHIISRLRNIKAAIKDAVEAATDIRLHLHSPEGMVAKDAGEWLAELKTTWDENVPSETKDNLIAAIIHRLCNEFTTQDDPDGTLFRQRITLAIRDAEQGILTWAPTAQEQLNKTKTPKAYTLAWAEKRLTYSLLYNCLIYYTPAALFSFRMVKNTLVSPLRLIHFLLTPVRMAVTHRAMQKVRPGHPNPSHVIVEYNVREWYQTIFRLVSMLTPQLMKTAAATGIMAYGLVQGGEYREAFLARAVSRLPGDLFWVSGFATWRQAIREFSMASHEPQSVLAPEQMTTLRDMLNLPPRESDADAPVPILHRSKRGSLVSTRTDEGAPAPPVNEKKVTARLLEASKAWRDSSALQWLSAKGTPALDGDRYFASDQHYIALRGLYWKIVPLDVLPLNGAAPDISHFFIEAKTHKGDPVRCEVNRINNTWDLTTSKIASDENSESKEGDPHNVTQLNDTVALIQHYTKLELKQYVADKSSLYWWLETEWKNKEAEVPFTPIKGINENIIIEGNKKYLLIFPHFWEYERENSSINSVLTNRSGNKINIINLDGKWYLNDWKSQRKYLYAQLTGLDVLSKECQIKINQILLKVFQRHPETAPEDAVKIADTVLSMLMLQNIQNKLYVTDILDIKYQLMLALPDTINQLIDAEQIEILHQCYVPMDLETLKKDLYHLYPTEIDNEHYTNTLQKYYLQSPPASLDNSDSHDRYYKGIAYCNELISNSKHSNNHFIFNDVLFQLTKKELTLMNNEVITPEENQELSQLNIAKYHLYASAKYLTLYESIIDAKDKIHFDADDTMLSLLNKAKIEAITLYYLDQENLNETDINLSDEEALREYADISALDNEASEYLNIIAAALFYQAHHPQETFGGFDFIKAQWYYKQQSEQFVKKIYTFNAILPTGFISYEDFRPSTDFASQSEYTAQFNDYMDKGSSEYESTLLTPLLLDQLKISLEDLSLPPKRWFTLKLICHDYDTTSHVGWPVHNPIRWPEKLNVIQLHNGNYLTISEVNGNMTVNKIKEVEYNFFLEQNDNKDTYFHSTKENAFLNVLIGPIPPSETMGQREYELAFDEEKPVPNFTKDAVQQSLHSCLNVIAGYQKKALATTSFTQKILEVLVPFYKELYDYLTDSHHIMNKTSLVIDFIFTCSALESVGLNLTILKKITISHIMRTVEEGIKKGLTQTTLSDFVASKLSKTGSHIDPSFASASELTEIISPIVSGNLNTEIIRREYTLITTPQTHAKFPLQGRPQYSVTLGNCGEFGQYKGIYTVAAKRMNEEANYFIKNGEEIYQVRWDKNKYTWRLIEHERPLGSSYGMPIQYLSQDTWAYNTQIGLRGGGIETEDVITQTNETVSDFYAKRSPLALGAVNSSKDIFTSEYILTNSAAILDLKKALIKAQKTSLGTVAKATSILKSKSFLAKAKELIRIFTNRNNEQNFLTMLNKLKDALKNLDVEQNIKLVNVEESDLFAQIAPLGHSASNNKYLAVNYAAYNKNKEMIFKENTKNVTERIKERYANDNFARVLIHEFTHANNVVKSTDAAGYIELLKLDGKHDVTKLLLKAKLGLPEVRNNADSLAEIIIILAKTSATDFFLDDFLEEYQRWESNVEKRISELNEEIKLHVANKIQLNWTSTVRSDIVKLKEEYNLEMCNQLISEINSTNRILFDTAGPLKHPFFDILGNWRE